MNQNVSSPGSSGCRASICRRNRGEVWCERGELNPHGLAPGGFSYPLQLSLPANIGLRFGVWTIPSPSPGKLPGLRCCPSSLYTFPAFGRAWLGIAILQVSPTLSSSTSPVSRASTQICLSPLRLPFRHARIAVFLITFYSWKIQPDQCLSEPFFFSFARLNFFFRMILMAAASRLVLMWEA
jgi:hypothetical protein